MSRLDPLLLLAVGVAVMLAVTAEAGGGKKLPPKVPAKKPVATMTEKLPPPVIVIDPGHGGKDPGAISRKKIREKDLVLAISKKLAASLRKKTGASVFLTRTRDRFITLGERDEIANRRQCDLFLSVHANASKNPRAAGLEIYYLNKATDEASRRLAARENEGAPKPGREIDRIVADLIQTAATEESADLALRVKRAVRRRLEKRYNLQGVRIRTALFYVLVGAKCPSLLVEVGFITNVEEGKRLKKGRFQSDLADALAEGVGEFLRLQETGGDL